MKFPYKLMRRRDLDIIRANIRDLNSQLKNSRDVLENTNILVDQRGERIDTLELSAMERERENKKTIDGLMVQIEVLQEHGDRREEHHINYRNEERRRHAKQMAILKGLNTKLRKRLVNV